MPAAAAAAAASAAGAAGAAGGAAAGAAGAAGSIGAASEAVGGAAGGLGAGAGAGAAAGAVDSIASGAMAADAAGAAGAAGAASPAAAGSSGVGSGMQGLIGQLLGNKEPGQQGGKTTDLPTSAGVGSFMRGLTNMQPLPSEHQPTGFLHLTSEDRKYLLGQSLQQMFAESMQRQQAQSLGQQPAGGQVSPLDQNTGLPMMADGGNVPEGGSAVVGEQGPEIVKTQPGGGASVTPYPSGQTPTPQGPQPQPQDASKVLTNPPAGPGALPATSGLWPHIGAHIEDGLIFFAAMRNPAMLMQLRQAQYSRNIQLAQMAAKNPILLQNPSAQTAVDEALGLPGAGRALSPDGVNRTIANSLNIPITEPGTPQPDGSVAPSVPAQLMRGRPDLDWKFDEKGYALPSQKGATFADRSAGALANEFDKAQTFYMGQGKDFDTAARLAALTAVSRGAQMNLPPPQWMTNLAYGMTTAKQAQDARNQSNLNFKYSTEFQGALGRRTGQSQAEENIPIPTKDAPFMFDTRTGQPMPLMQPGVDEQGNQIQRPTTMTDVRQFGVRVTPQALAAYQNGAASTQFLQNWLEGAKVLFPETQNKDTLTDMLFRGGRYTVGRMTRGTVGVSPEETEAITKVQESRNNMLLLLRGIGERGGRIAAQQIENAEKSGPGYYETNTTAMARIRFYAGLHAAGQRALGVPLSPAMNQLLNDLHTNGQLAHYDDSTISKAVSALNNDPQASRAQSMGAAPQPSGLPRPSALPNGVTVEVTP